MVIKAQPGQELTLPVKGKLILQKGSRQPGQRRPVSTKTVSNITLNFPAYAEIPATSGPTGSGGSRGVIVVRCKPTSETGQQVMTSASLVPGQLPERHILPGLVRHRSIHTVLPVHIGAEPEQHQILYRHMIIDTDQKSVW